MLKDFGDHWIQLLLQTSPGLGPMPGQDLFPGCVTASLGERFANTSILPLARKSREKCVRPETWCLLVLVLG